MSFLKTNTKSDTFSQHSIGSFKPQAVGYANAVSDEPLVNEMFGQRSTSRRCRWQQIDFLLFIKREKRGRV